MICNDDSMCQEIQSILQSQHSSVCPSVPTGGNTLLAGLPERLQRELGCLEPGGPGGRVRVSSPADRGSSVWRGGAALASMPAPGGCAWISREEYEEYGPQIVFRKCF